MKATRFFAWFWRDKWFIAAFDYGGTHRYGRPFGCANTLAGVMDCSQLRARRAKIRERRS